MKKSTGELVEKFPVSLKPYTLSEETKIPNYLKETYWWAYVHPRAVQIFERQWLVNMILWGNFTRLRNMALDEIDTSTTGKHLQVACVYGDFSQEFASRLSPESELHIIDVAPVQLENVKHKIKNHSNVYLHHQDSAYLEFDDAVFDNVVVFFLLHEQPESIRKKTVEQVMRVLKPGGKAIFIDYHQPHWANPLRYVMYPVLNFLEPFALDIWKQEIIEWLPDDLKPEHLNKKTLFGDLYQKVVMVR
jgi:ubiquinone/menaquinone biosynthesis C-methylase UbiE